MKLKRKLTVILLTAVLLIGSLPLTALPGAAEGPNARLIHADVRVYAGGLYNIDANCDDPDATYKWVCWYDDDHYVELPDNDGYHGTDTPHFSFTTTDGKAGDKDWGSLRFGCKVTSHGKDYLTDSYNMHIMSKEQLRRDLEEDGYGISRFGIVGGTFVGETDGVLYYDLPAGGSFSFDFSYGVPNETQYLESEITVGIEMYAIENGGITRVGTDHNEYTPYILGDGAVTARIDYVVFINGERFTVLDSRQAVVNTVVRQAESEAEAGRASPIYKDRYEQSFQLGRVEKGARVFVIENYGTWSKVAAGGVIGYMPNYALTFYDTIGVVEIFAQEPCHLAPVSFDVRFGSDKYRLWDGAEPVTWYDKTAGRYLTEGELFNKNHTYALDIWVEAEDGKLFRSTVDYKLDVNAYFNGEAQPVGTAYEQVYNKVLSAYREFGHVHDLKKHTQLNPTCETEGMLTYWYCDCGARFADYAGTERVTDENWGVIPARGHKESEWKSDGTQHCKYCLRRECGEEIYYLRGDHAGGLATCKNPAFCEVCGLPYGEVGTHIFSDEWNLKTAEGHAHKCVEMTCGEHTGFHPHRPGPAATAGNPQICLDCGYVIAYAEGDNPFTDVPEGKWYTNAVLWCYSKGYMTGTSATTFEPGSPFTRAMFVTVLAKIDKANTDGYTGTSFSDVPEGKWYSKPIQWAYRNEYASGLGNGRFGPNDPVTREQIAQFLYNYSQKKGWETSGSVSLGSYPDGNKVSNYAKNAVAWAVGNGLISGVKEGDTVYLRPKGTATRAQVAVIVKNYIDLIG